MSEKHVISARNRICYLTSFDILWSVHNLSLFRLQSGMYSFSFRYFLVFQ